MPNVTVLGASQAVVTIPVNSTAAAAIAQANLNAVSAAILAGTVTAINYTGAVPTTTGSTELVFSGSSAQSASIPAGANFVSLVSNATAAPTITDAQTTAETIVAGTGGLTYTQTAASVAGSLIVAGGGTSNIDLAAGANTVSLDVGGGTGAGSATVNGSAGGALIIDNANSTGAAILALAGHDTAQISGLVFTFLNDATNSVSVLGGGAAFFGGAAENISVGPGNVTIGVVGTAANPTTETITGATSTVQGGNTIYVGFASGGVSGSNLFINPNVQNVTVFAGSGATTLYGAGDVTGASNTGVDFILGGTGYFHVGSGGGAFVESATSITGAATTLVGGGQGDALFAQSANVSLKGSAGTTFMDAGGYNIAGGVVSLGQGNITEKATAGVVYSVAGASGGVTINAGASNAGIFGAVGGANTIISGTGSSTVFGHSGATGGSGNVYMDGGVGTMAIEDFTSSDTFKLTGGITATGVTTSGSASIVTLSDGTKITIADGLVTSTNVATFFHT